MLDVIVSEVLLYGDYYSLTTLSERTSSLSSSYTYLSFQDLLNLREPYSELSYTDAFSIFDTVYQLFDLLPYSLNDNNVVVNDLVILSDDYNIYKLQERVYSFGMSNAFSNLNFTDTYSFNDLVIIKIDYNKTVNDLLYVNDTYLTGILSTYINNVIYYDSFNSFPIYLTQNYLNCFDLYNANVFNHLFNQDVVDYQDAYLFNISRLINTQNSLYILDGYDTSIESSSLIFEDNVYLNDNSNSYLDIYLSDKLYIEDTFDMNIYLSEYDSLIISDKISILDNVVYNDTYVIFDNIVLLNLVFEFVFEFDNFLTLNSDFYGIYYVGTHSESIQFYDVFYDLEINTLHFKDSYLNPSVFSFYDNLKLQDKLSIFSNAYENDTLFVYDSLPSVYLYSKFNTALSFVDYNYSSLLFKSVEILKLRELNSEAYKDNFVINQIFKTFTYFKLKDNISLNDNAILKISQWTRVHFNLSDSLITKTFFNIKSKETLNIFEFTKPLLISNVKYVDTFAISDIFIDRNILNTILLNTITNQFTFITYPISFIKNNNVYTLNGKAITSTSISNNLITLKFNNLSTQSVKRIDKIYTNAITETSTAELNNITLVNNKYVFNVPKGLRSKEYSLTLKNLSDVEYINIRLISEDRNKI
ncbi:MAG: hypothetical protein QXW35_03620 [Candidatus Aenigmatarchaeota archaeon]